MNRVLFFTVKYLQKQFSTFHTLVTSEKSPQYIVQNVAVTYKVPTLFQFFNCLCQDICEVLRLINETIFSELVTSQYIYGSLSRCTYAVINLQSMTCCTIKPHILSIPVTKYTCTVHVVFVGLTVFLCEC